MLAPADRMEELVRATSFTYFLHFTFSFSCAPRVQVCVCPASNHENGPEKYINQFLCLIYFLSSICLLVHLWLYIIKSTEFATYCYPMRYCSFVNPDETDRFSLLDFLLASSGEYSYSYVRHVNFQIRTMGD